MRLRRQQRHRPFEALLAEAGGDLHAGMAGADDNDRGIIHGGNPAAS
jgi:hypothetical protein